MDATGLGLAAVGLCIKYGKELYAVCQSFRNAEREVRESILEVEGVWLKTQSQVEAVRDLWYSFDERVQIHQNHVLMLLYEKLQHAITIINGLNSLADQEPSLKNLMRSNKGDLKKIKYVAYAKKKLQGVVKDLYLWQKMFDPSWYLLIRIAPSTIDRKASEEHASTSQELFIIQELRRAHLRNEEPVRSKTSMFLSSQYLDEKREQISYTSTQVGHAGRDLVIIDSLRIASGNDIQLATKDARDIARILATVDPTVFGLLTCRGVIQIRDHPANVTGFDFIFSMPNGLIEPQSLRTFLLSANHRYSLDGRFRLARLLARSISFLHSAQIVHKNISPETILLLEDPQTELHTPFLVGFEKFRRADGRTYMSGDTMWEKNLYRHPQRQGERPEEEYKMQHDIYSLGVTLLELGLNTSFVHYDSTSTSDLNPKGAFPNPILNISEALANKDIRARASQIRKKFISVAEDRLPGLMGQVYTDVVISCLTCLDKDNPGFGDVNDFTDEDGILVGVRYIEKILYQFEEIKF